MHSQLAEQQITFPTAAAFAHPVPGTEITPSMVGTVSKYAGEQLTTGQQAQVYANDFIAVHLKEIGGGQTYAQLSAQAMALPKGSPAYTAAEAQGADGISGNDAARIAARGLRLQRLCRNRTLGSHRGFRCSPVLWRCSWSSVWSTHARPMTPRNC